MTPQAYVAIIVFLFILLLLGWSTTLFAFVTGTAIGVMGVRMYDSEILTNLATVGGSDADLIVTGVYSPHSVTLVDKGGKEKLVIANNPNIPKEKDVPEHPIGVVIPCYDKTNVHGTALDMVLVRTMNSDKNMLITKGILTGENKDKKYYLELAPQYTVRDENQSVIGIRALKIGKAEKQDSTQATEKHTRLLELLAPLLNKIYCGKVPKGVELLGASKHTSTIPDQGPIALLSHTGQSRMYTISNNDSLGGEDKLRGDVTIVYDDEKIIMPVIDKHYPSANEVKSMPLLHRIEEMADRAKLLIIVQDYITGALSDGTNLPDNVIYIGQALRDDPSRKMYLNAFINPKRYDKVLRILEGLSL